MIRHTFMAEHMPNSRVAGMTLTPPVSIEAREAWTAGEELTSRIPIRFWVDIGEFERLRDFLSAPSGEYRLVAADGTHQVRLTLSREGTLPFDHFAAGAGFVNWTTGMIASRTGNVALSRTELRLFGALFDAKGSTIERSRLIKWTWPTAEASDGANALGVYIHLLRQRLSAIALASALETVRGVGYCLAA
jgi:hypothetical protein